MGQTTASGVYLSMSPDQLARVVDQHAAALTLYARQWCAAPEDVVQEAFIKLAAQRRPPENVAAWLYRVVRNLALTAARAAKRRRHHESAAAANTSSWFLPSDFVGLDGEAATAALAALPLEQRETMVAHLWGGLTFDQIGELCGVSASTAHRRYLAALAALRERLRVSCPNNSIPK